MAATSPVVDSVPARVAGERPMYTSAAVIALAVAFVGFAPTYFLKPLFGTPELTTLKHLHGAVMTAWLVIFLVQARLVASGNTATHRKLGVAGAAVAVLVVVVGIQAAIAAARAGSTPLPQIPPLAFFIMPVGEMVVFTALVGAALALRRKSAWHKRLMLVGTVAMLTPAFARWPVIAGAGPLAFFGLTDLVVIACMIYDKRRNGRLHPAFIAGLAVVMASQAGRLALARTPAWMDFAKAVVF